MATFSAPSFTPKLGVVPVFPHPTRAVANVLIGPYIVVCESDLLCLFSGLAYLRAARALPLTWPWLEQGFIHPPAEPPIEYGSILIHHGHILAVGPTATTKIPRHGTVIDCKGLVVTAGFWNSHVHVLMPGLLHAEKLSPEVVTSQLQAIFTRWGFTTVFDIASVLHTRLSFAVA